jgi:hypothetical protein
MRDFAISPIPARVEKLWAEIGLAVGLGLVLAAMGPFRTYEGEPLQRIGFWIGLSAAWFVLAMAVDLLIDHSPLPDRLDAPRRLVIKVMLAAFPMLLFVAPATQALFGWAPGLHKLLCLYPKTLLIGAGLTLVSAALLSRPAHLPGRDEPASSDVGVDDAAPLERAPSTIEPNPGQEDNADACPLQSRLPPHLRGPILCLQTEDHYVRIHTEKGSTLVLMRMRDAVEAMNGSCGLRVHRSWWVSLAAIKVSERSGRTLILELVNGLVVPVSQPYAATVRESFSPS